MAGVRVVEMGQWMAGPTAARLLADNGADVVRIDPPSGWSWSHEADAVLNRGKTRLTLDFTDPDDLVEARRLISASDVVVENLRTGTLARCGLDHESVRAENPGIVYLSLPGFASTDAENADVAAFEGVIASATGQFSDMGVNRVLMGIPASYSPLPLGSAYAGVFGAMAVGMALRARLGHGRGDHIEVPVASSLLEALAYNSMHVEDVPPRYLSRREQAIATGVHGISYDQIQRLLDPFYRTYRCSDGRPFYVVAVSHRQHPKRVLEVLGLFDEAVAAGLPMHDPYLPVSQWPRGADCTLLAHPISTSWADWLSERIGAVLATRSSAAWEQTFADHGIPAVAHRTTAEWLGNDHALAAGLLVDVDDRGLGSTRQMGPVLWTEDGNGPLVEVASSGDDDPGAGWLDGLTVVDLTNVIAGPTIGSTLARFGAQVIKVDLPEPSFDPWNTILCGLHSNRGKRSVLLDVCSELGRPAFERLLARADVITVNASRTQLVRLGLTGEDLARLAPRAVLCHLDAWGGPEEGPWSQRPGYDDLVQAATGIMARFGGGLDTPEEHAHFGTIDVLAGLTAATATAFALYAREVTGRAPVARASLVAAGQLIQAAYMCAHDGEGPVQPSGRGTRGESLHYRVYETSDGWVFVVVPPKAVAAFDDLVAGDPEGALAKRSSEHWQKVAGPLGVTVQPLRTLSDQRAAHTGSRDVPWSTSSYYFTTTEDHAAGHAVTLVAPVAVRPASARIVIPADAHKYGEDTVAVLGELGYDATAVEEMVAAGAAGLSWSQEYLPS